jgi:2-amino-4-hydroxy-6-hydroxymethyldihydropteridine diphosphokinase
MFEAGLIVQRLSGIYETEPVANSAQPTFLNMVAELDGGALPRSEQLMARLLRVEYALGRTRTEVMGPRTIDLDLLLRGAETSTTPFLTLPHPRMHLRRFVMTPLVELAPNLVHPIINRTISDLLNNLPDKSAVKRWLP